MTNSLSPASSGEQAVADVIVRNGRIATVDATGSFASAVAIKDGRFLAVGNDADVMMYKGDATHVIDVGDRVVAIQNRMGFQGEYFINRYGKEAAEQTPPVRRMLEMGVPVGAGTDATRVSSYNPWVSLSWLVTGQTVGGVSLYPQSNRLDRLEALRLYSFGFVVKYDHAAVYATSGNG